MTATHNIHVATDPESKIRFLETTLHGQDWRATLIFEPSSAGLRHANHTAQMLQSRGVLVKHGRDKDGHVVLEAHRTGHDTNWVGLFREHGLIKGATHTITNPLLPLHQLYHATHDAVNYVHTSLRDPVRLGAVSYIAADVCQSLTGGANQDAIAKSEGLIGKTKDYFSKMKNPKNFTQSFGGMLFLAQSLLYFQFAKTGTELSVEDLNRAYKKAKKEGKEIHHVDDWADDLSAKKHRIVPKFIRDYPIQSGAVIQNTGMLFLFAHGLLERKYKKGLLENPGALSSKELLYADRYINKGGFLLDMYRTIASFTGWAFLMYPIKEHPEKSNNPVERAFQTFEENPQHFSSAIATSTSIAGAISGKYFKGNKMQALGESLYLPGDLFLSQAKNNKYGASDESNQEVIRDAVAKFIASSPMILGENARREFSCEIAKQLLDQSAHYETERAKPAEREALKLKLNEARDAVLEELCKGELLVDPRYNALVAATRNLLVRFPKQQRDAAAEEIVRELTTKVASVHVTAEELKHGIALDALASSTEHFAPVISPHEMAGEIKKLANVIPDVNAGQTAAMLYDAIGGLLAGKTPSRAAGSTVSAKHAEYLQPLAEHRQHGVGSN